MSALRQLAERLVRKNDPKPHFDSGKQEVNSYFRGKTPGLTLLSALDDMATGDNWVILKRIHEDAIYGELLRSLLPELSDISSVDMKSTYYDPTLTLFITSPHRITPYHLDGETNFLAQIHGTKLAYIYDGRDQRILSDQALEKYWTGHLRKIEHPAWLAEGTWKFQMKPGNGVFNPAAFPHWLQNGNEISISLSVNFKRKKNDIVAAHRFNYVTRRLGMKPTPPGRSAALDRVKRMTLGQVIEAGHKARQVVRNRFGV